MPIGRFSTFDATLIPVSRSKGQRSRSPGSLMLTRIVRHILRTARPTNFKLGIKMEDDDPHQPQAPWPPRSKIKVVRSRDRSEPSCPNAVLVSLEAGGGIPCRPNPAATFLVLACITYLELWTITPNLGLFITWSHHGVVNCSASVEIVVDALVADLTL